MKTGVKHHLEFSNLTQGLKPLIASYKILLMNFALSTSK
jgi:hypothetical protein